MAGLRSETEFLDLFPMLTLEITLVSRQTFGTGAVVVGNHLPPNHDHTMLYFRGQIRNKGDEKS